MDEAAAPREIRLSESEASRVLQVLVELQRERRVGDALSDAEGPQLVDAGPFGRKRI